MDFLDLTDATDTEKRRLQDLLYNNKCTAVQLPFDVGLKKPFVAKAGSSAKVTESESVAEKGLPEKQAEESLSPRNGHREDGDQNVLHSATPSPHSSLSADQQSFVPQSHDSVLSLFPGSPVFDPSSSHKLSPHVNQSGAAAAMPSLQPIPFPIVTHMPVMSSMAQMMRPPAPGIDVRSGAAATGGSHSPLMSAGATGMPFSFIGPNGAPFMPGQPMPPVTAGQLPGPGGYHVSTGPNGQQQMFPPFISYPCYFMPQQAYPHLPSHDTRPLEDPMLQREHFLNQQLAMTFGERDMAGSRSGGSNHSHGSGGRTQRRNNRNQRKQSVSIGDSVSPVTPRPHPHHHHHNSQHQLHSNQQQSQAECVHPVTPSHVVQGSDSRQTRSSSSTSSSSHVVIASPPTSLSSCPCFSDEETSAALAARTTAGSSELQPQPAHQTTSQVQADEQATLAPQQQQESQSVPVTPATATSPAAVASDAKKVSPKKRNSPSASKAAPQINGHSAAGAAVAPTGKPPSGPKSWSSLFKSAQSAAAAASAALHTMPPPPASSPNQPLMYDRVCLGGTFDSIHEGHRKLLNESLSKCSEVLTIGVTDESMIRKKVLCELIKPVEDRIEDVRRYCESHLKSLARTGVQLNIVPISDPFGPAITDSSLKAIVVSEETLAGGAKINEIRKKSGMPLLAVHSIRLVPSEHKESSLEEDKVSSSTLRIRKLGTLLREPAANSRLPKRPYLIGLTGGIASGKTNIANEFKRLGAGVIDCDKMAHQTYVPGTACYEKIVREFGRDIIDQRTSEILRKKLGDKIFANAALKAKLESIVWPEASKLVFQEAERLRSREKKEVVIFEATQIIEAKWSQRMHQVWVSVIPEEVAVKRVMERDNMSENLARQRVASQMPNKERVSHAHVVFSSLWDRDFTRAQVQKAWNMLHKRFLRAV